MAKNWSETKLGSNEGVPKPDGYEGNNDDAWIMTSQDGRVVGTSDENAPDPVTNRNARPIKKH